MSSLLSTKISPALRNILPSFRKAVFPCNSIQKNYWRRRGDVFSELSSAMRSAENCMRDMDKEMNRFFEASPVKFPKVFSPFDFGRIREIPVVSTGDGRSYKLQLDVEDMEPENINITLRNNELTVTARRDEKREDGSRFVRENTYHYTLPSEINADAIRSSLTDGVLTIEAPLPALETKEIPVKIECGQKDMDSIDSAKDKK